MNLGLLKGIAERLNNNESNDRFLSAFLKGSIFFDMPLDMEKCGQEFDYSNYREPNNKDGEWTYQFSRMEYLHRLVLAYSATDDEKIIDKYFAFVNAFFQENDYEHDCAIIDKNGALKSRILDRLGRKDLVFPTYRTLDTAIRNYSLLVDRFYLEDKFDDEIINRLSSDTIKTVDRLREFDKFSNWGIIICALSACSFLMLGYPDRAENSLNFLKVCLVNQINEDGGHRECSAMYHTQCLLAMLRLIYWARQAQYELDPLFETVAVRMATHSFYHASPTGYQDQFGDSDIVSLNTVFAISHTLLGLEDVMSLNDDYDAFLLMEFPSLKIGDYSPFTSKNEYQIAFRDSFCYNSGEFFWNLYNGVSSSSHKHADNGQISLWYKGVPYVVDSGRFSYSNRKMRRFFRRPNAHSTIVIDKGRSWGAKGPNWFRELPEVDPISFVSGFVCAQYRFAGRETVKRYVKTFSDCVVVVDRVECKKKHSYRAQWVVERNLNVEAVNGNSIRIGELYVNSFLPGLKAEDTYISRYYNEIEMSKRVVIDVPFKDEIINVYSLSKRPQSIGFENGVFYIDEPDLRIDLEDLK